MIHENKSVISIFMKYFFKSLWKIPVSEKMKTKLYLVLKWDPPHISQAMKNSKTVHCGASHTYILHFTLSFLGHRYAAQMQTTLANNHTCCLAPLQVLLFYHHWQPPDSSPHTQSFLWKSMSNTRGLSTSEIFKVQT